MKKNLLLALGLLVAGAAAAENPVRQVQGGPKQLECRVTPANATRQGIIWESSDPSVATVDKFGVLHGHKKGSVEITAYSWDEARPLAGRKSEEYKTDGIQPSVKIAVSK